MKDQRINTKHLFLLEFSFLLCFVFFYCQDFENDLLGEIYYRL